PSSSTDDLAQLLRDHHAPVLVRVNDNSHAVLVTGESGGKFTIVDPGHFARTTLDDYDNKFLIKGYISDPTDLSKLTFVVEGDSADLLVTNLSGQQTGTDASSGNILDNIPQSVTFTEPSQDDLPGSPSVNTDQFVSISQPPGGTYTLSLTGNIAA